MTLNISENNGEMAEDGEQEHRYKKYLESSWLINEAACEDALRRATDDVEFNKLDSHSKESMHTK